MQNSLLRCYNMFPSMFGSFQAMIDYLPTLKVLGFKCVWLNPITQPGNITVERASKTTGIMMHMKSSIYAMYQEASFNRSLGDHMHGAERVKAFTERAVSLGIAPIFDLVTHHMSKDSPLINQHPHWFVAPDHHSGFSDVRAFCYEELNIGNEIIRDYWKPLIDRYMDHYGFTGVRVDCIGKVPHYLRQALYSYIKSKNSEAIIFEEALFDDRSPQRYAEEVMGVGGTHITGSAYYRKREWHGGLERSHPYGAPGDPNNEEFYKANMVSHGVVHFAGNHDHDSCAMTACLELARERLQADPTLYSLYNQAIIALHHKASVQSFERRLLFSFVHDIITELKQPEAYRDTFQRFKRLFLDKLSISMFAGSGGYYLLSGDEVGNLHTPCVFIRTNASPFYPEVTLEVLDEHPISEALYQAIRSQLRQEGRHNFDTLNHQEQRQWIHHTYHTYKACIQDAIRSMARALLSRDLIHTLPSLQKKELTVYARNTRLLAPYEDHIKHQLNASDDTAINELKAVLRQRNYSNYKERITNVLLQAQFSIPHPLTATNHWGAPPQFYEGVHDFIKQANMIIQNLLPRQPGFWSELFKIDEQLMAIVRKNGPGYDSTTDLIIINLSLDKPKELDCIKLTKQIGNWLQQRGFPPIKEHWRGEHLLNNYYDFYDANPDFAKAFACIASSDAKIRLHFGIGIQVTANMHLIATHPPKTTAEQVQQHMPPVHIDIAALTRAFALPNIQ